MRKRASRSRSSGQAFRPWRADYKVGAWLIAGAAVVGLLTWASADLGTPIRMAEAAVCVLMASMGFHLISRGGARRHGKRVEERAVQHLRKALSQEIALRESVMLPSGGDADAVIESQPRHVVEIKSHSAVRVDRRLIGSDRLVNSKDKQPFKESGAYIAQARKAAQSLGGVPVLWFPAAQVATKGTIDGVQVVTGPANYLVKTCGLRSSGWFS